MHTHPLTLLANSDVQRLRPAAEEQGRGALRAQPRFHPDGESLGSLVRAAAAGDDSAWASIVERFTPALKATARGFRLAPADVDDVVQSTWLAAFRHIGQLEHPEALGAWLLVTTRRGSLRKHQRSVREIVTDEPPALVASDRESPLHVIIETERRDALHAAVDRLPNRQGALLGTLLSAPDSSYDDISVQLDMPVGSIGPTRRRALERLREDRRLATLLGDETAV